MLAKLINNTDGRFVHVHLKEMQEMLYHKVAMLGLIQLIVGRFIFVFVCI